MAITMPPMIRPKKTMSSGSINEVRAERVVSTSSSYVSATLSSISSMRPLFSPAAIMRIMRVGRKGLPSSEALRVLPCSMPLRAAKIDPSITLLPIERATTCMASRIGTPLTSI